MNWKTCTLKPLPNDADNRTPKSNHHNTDEKELSEISPRLYMQPILKDTCTRVVIMNKR